MGQAISNFVANLCGGDTGQDEIQSSTRASPTHIFPQRPGPQLIPTPLRWSRGSDSFTHPVTVRDRIVRNPPPGSNHAGGSTSWTRDVSQLGLGLGLGLGHLVIRDLSDSFTHSVTNSVRNRIVRNPPPGSDPAGESTSWSREVSQLDLGHLVTRDVSDSFTHSGTNSVRNWIVRNPTPGSDPDGYSSSQTREVSQLGHGHLVTRDESDSVSQLGRDPVISSSNWLEEFLGDSSITVGTDTIEVLKEGIERDEERDTIPIQSQISELLQNRLSSSHGADLVAHTVPIPPPGSDPVLDSTSPSSESDSVNQLRRDPAITLPKWLDVSLKDSSVTVLEEKKEVVREVLREERERYGKRGRGGKVGRVERWMKHYSSFHKILLVGEGDFSFSACLAVAFGCAHNIIATSLDSTGFLSSNYMNAMSNIKSLTSRGAKVMHGVDATQMANHFVFDGMTFDRIVFNFPHGGFLENESRETQLRRHRKLVRLFMKNAKKMIDKRGEIHVSHKSNGFFLEWNLEQLATNEGLRLIESPHFRLTDYPGYHTKYGFGGDKNFDCNPSKTYKFGLKN